VLTRDYLISTVTSAAESLDLTDLATVKSELSIKDGDTAEDAFLSRAITQLSAVAQNYCNRVFPVQSYQDQFRFSRWHRRDSLRVDQGRPLRLANAPVQIIASVTEDGVGLTPGDYEFDPSTGLLYRLWDSQAGHWNARLITVQYDAGYEEIPADVVEAVLRLVTMRFKAKGRDPMLVQTSAPNTGERRYWVGNLPGQSGSLPTEIEAILDPYREALL
jgi:hypothetical protein